MYSVRPAAKGHRVRDWGVRTHGLVGGWVIDGSSPVSPRTPRRGKSSRRVCTVTDLHTLGGSSSGALAINESGEVVGWALTPAGVRQAVLWRVGEVVAVGTLPGKTRGQAWGINDPGVIVGASSGYADQSDRAFVWQGGVMRELGALGGSAGSGSASAVNNRGQIVGGSFTGTDPLLSDHHAVLWDHDTIVDLGTLPEGNESHAWRIDDAGLVVGVAQEADGTDQAVLWDRGCIRRLGGLGGVSSVASAVSASGEVVGAAYATDGSCHAFLWRDGSMTDLGAPDRSRQSWAYDINDAGQVVGSALVGSPPGVTYRAVLWQDGRMVDLNDLTDQAQGWELTSARGINQRGQIAGTGLTGGEAHGFLLQLH